MAFKIKMEIQVAPQVGQANINGFGDI